VSRGPRLTNPSSLSAEIKHQHPCPYFADLDHCKKGNGPAGSAACLSALFRLICRDREAMRRICLRRDWRCLGTGSSPPDWKCFLCKSSSHLTHTCLAPRLECLQFGWLGFLPPTSGSNAWFLPGPSQKHPRTPLPPLEVGSGLNLRGALWTSSHCVSFCRHERTYLALYGASSL